MSENQKHQVNELLKEQMRLAENLAIQKDKARLAANSVLWEIPGLILFVVGLLTVFFILTTMSAGAALYYTGSLIKQLGRSRRSAAYGPFSTPQIGIALLYPPLYNVLNAMTIYPDRLTPTGAHFLVQGLSFISAQSRVTTSPSGLSGATLTSTGFAGDLENIAQSSFDDVASLLYDCWYNSPSSSVNANGGNAFGGTDDDTIKKALWKTWMGAEYRWIAPNIACFLTNPLVSCGGLLNAKASTDPNFEPSLKAQVASYIERHAPWRSVLSYGMCGYALLSEDNTPDDMFANVFGGAPKSNGQPFPCKNVGLQNELSFGTMGASVGSAISFTLFHPVGATSGRAEAAGGVLNAILAFGVTAGGAVGGYFYGNSITKGMGCKPNQGLPHGFLG